MAALDPRRYPACRNRLPDTRRFLVEGPLDLQQFTGRLVDKGAHEKQIIDVTLLARGRLVAQLHVNVSGDWRRSGLVSSRHFVLGRTFGSLALFATRLVDRPAPSCAPAT